MKTKKTLFIFTIIFFLLSFTVVCHAVDLDMTDLDIDTDLTTDTTTSNTENSNNIDSTENDDEYDSTATNANNNENLNDSSEIVVNDMNSTSSSGMQLSDILNIFLIVIGVLLILLSIAILIRLGK